MQVKNKSTGEVETMRYGQAVAAVNAGTHEHVNVDPAQPIDNEPAQSVEIDDLDSMTKDELLAEAEKRGVSVKASDTKADILKALKG